MLTPQRFGYETADSPRTKTISDPQHDHQAPILALPTETVFSVARCLDEEHVALLSLTCKHLYHMLRPLYDLTLKDSQARLNFLCLLEVDYPELYTCRDCVRMYKWRRIVERNGYCPRHQNPSRGYLVPHDYWRIYAPSGPITISPAVVDLVLREHQLGPGYGISASLPDGASIIIDGVHRSWEARVVEGDFMMAVQWYSEADDRHKANKNINHIAMALRCHGESFPGSIHLARSLMSTSPVGHFSTKEKCQFCETDRSLCVQFRPGSYVVTARVWRNYGSYGQRSDSQQQIFIRRAKDKTDAESLARRDLRSKFRT